MMTTSVDPKDFSQIVPAERFSVDPPQINPLIAASPIDVTRTESGMDFSVVDRIGEAEPPSVERTLHEVIARCEKDLSTHPRNPQSMINLALALINAGKSDAAKEMLEDVIALEPKNYVALTSLALIFINRGQLGEATEVYVRLHSEYPRDPSPLINLASIALRQEDFVGAAAHLEKAVRLDECSVMAKYLLAMVLLRLGKHNQSIGLLRTISREGGPSAEVNQGLAIAYLVSGDHKKSERAFLAALTINKHLTSAVHGLAILRLQQNRFDEVVEGLLDHLSYVPGDMQSRELLAQAYVRLSQFARARGQLSLLVPTGEASQEDRLELARISNNIGFCFAQEGKVNEAEIWLKRSVALDGRSTAAPYNNLGRMYFLRGRFHDALDALNRAGKLGIATSETSMLRSSALIQLQRFEEAIEVLQALINAASPPGNAYAELGWLLADWKEQYDAAIAVLREGFERDPSNVFVLNNLAYVHLMRGEPAYARAILDQVKDLSDNAMVLTATRGLLLLWEGDIEGGEALYKEAEALAFQRGFRDLAYSIRQKKHLELSRAYLRSGRPAEAVMQLESGLGVPRGQRLYRYCDQLAELKKQLALPSGRGVS